MPRLTHLICFALFASAPHFLVAQEEAPAAEKREVPVIESINDAMQQMVDKLEMTGAVTMVAHQGKIVHLGAVGSANLEKDRPMRPFAMFAIASMTKPITATALMILQEEGKLNIDDKVSKYLPDYANLTLEEGKTLDREITIRDCITHTAGFNSKQTFTVSLEEHVAELATKPLAFQPGSKWKYAPGLNVAGRIIEIVAEKPYHEFVKERILDPLQMTNSTFFPDEKQLRRIVTIYQPSEDKQSLVPIENHISDPSNVKAANPSGGLFATARDLFRFYQMILNEGKLRKKRIVSAESVAAMTSPQTGDLETGFTPGNCWGLGWCVVREPQDVTEMLSPGTFGHGGAFGTQGWVDPKTETIYVLMMQRRNMGNSDGSDVRKAFQQAATDALGL